MSKTRGSLDRAWQPTASKAAELGGKGGGLKTQDTARGSGDVSI